MNFPFDLRLWSKALGQNWAFVLMALILFIFGIRYICLHESVRAVRACGRETYRQVLSYYLPRSAVGWVMIATGIALAEWVISFPGVRIFFLSRREGIVLSPYLLIVGILFHIRALLYSTAAVLKDRAEPDRTA